MFPRRWSVLSALVTVLALSACSPDEGDAPVGSGATSTPTSSPTPAESAPPSPTESAEEQAPEGPRLVVEVHGEKISPNAEEIDLAAGEPLIVQVTASRDGELHVHSKPEQVLEFNAGRSTQELVIDTPGSVEIEEHETGAVVALLQVGG